MTAVREFTLAELAAGVQGAVVRGDNKVRVSGIACDSRKVKPGDLFVAVPGTHADGLQFLPRAVQAGARAALARAGADVETAPAIFAPDVRLAMGLMAARLFGHPDHKVSVIAVTGTNGKTTITYLLESILKAAGLRPGVIGTISRRFETFERAADTTTPESVDIFAMLEEMRVRGATHAVMEVSSHALDQKRVAGMRIRRAILTNVTRDHLDYHQDLDHYYLAKRRLFTEVIRGAWTLNGDAGSLPPLAVINLDDERGRGLYAELAQLQVPRLGYAVDSCEAEVRAQGLHLHDRGLEATIAAPGGSFSIASPLVGRHNVENILAAVGIALGMGIGVEAVQKGLWDLKKVPGRLEPVPNAAGITVLVDYAHTPDALAHAVAACRDLTRGRLITVFGCGGDRDPGKRAPMGRIAAAGSDLAIATSDNPRAEDPLAIIGQVLEGVEESGARKLESGDEGGKRAWAHDLQAGPSGPGPRFAVEPDRRAAIRLAIALARPGDLVLIAGKGHEDYQILGKDKVHFDDREEAGAALKERESP